MDVIAENGAIMFFSKCDNVLSQNISPMNEYRISQAALLRILLPFAEMARDIRECDPLKLSDTLHAVYNYILDPDFDPARIDVPDGEVDMEMFESMKADIDRSARRCAAARAAARARKAARTAESGELSPENDVKSPAKISDSFQNALEIVEKTLPGIDIQSLMASMKDAPLLTDGSRVSVPPILDARSAQMGSPKRSPSCVMSPA